MDKLKIKLLEMLQWFHNICLQYNLRYYLVEGSMLGAMRHQGFIPWDDDIDIGMPRVDYEKLEIILGQKIWDKKYLLETPNSSAKEYIYTFSKVYDVTTTEVDHNRLDITRGIYIDIFPLDGIGNTYNESIKNYKSIGRKMDFLTMRVVAERKGRKWYKNCAVKIARIIPTAIMNEKILIQKICKECSNRSFDEMSFVGNLVSTYRSKEIMPREYYGTPHIYQFEGIDIYGVEKPEEYLTTLYGDWRRLPPVSKRESAHNRQMIDLEKPFINV